MMEVRDSSSRITFMSILLSCPCGKKLRVKDELAGKKVKCPGCAAILPVPGPVVETPAPPEEEPEETEARPRAKKEPDPPQEEEQGNFWVAPHALGGEIIALSETAFYLADLNDQKEFKSAKKALARGESADEVLAEAKTIIQLDDMRKVESNLYHRFFDIKWKADPAADETE